MGSFKMELIAAIQHFPGLCISKTANDTLRGTFIDFVLHALFSIKLLAV